MSTRETKAYIHLEHLKHNLEYYQKMSQKEVFAVIKANAYGHGDVNVAKYLEKQGVNLFCVSSLDEALHLKEAGVTKDILIFSYVNPHAILKYNDPQFIFTIVSKAWFDEILSLDLKPRMHLKVNTGMNRVGVKNKEDIQDILNKSPVPIEGIYTHYSSSDSDAQETQRQDTLFTSLILDLNYPFKWIHASNTHGVHLKNQAYNAVRVGIGLYGYEKNVTVLKPVLTLSTQIIHIEQLHKGESVGYNQTYTLEKDSKIATLPIGYADGFDVRNRHVFIHGKEYPIVGKICMDQTMVLIDDSISLLDDVEIISKSRDFDRIEKETGIMPYIIMTSLSPRVTRIYC